MPFGNSEMTLSPTSHLPNDSEPQSPLLFSSPTGNDARTRVHTRAHAHCLVNWFLAPPSLTCFKDGGAFIADKRPAAHCGARAQVEFVRAHGLQVTQDPLGGVGVTDVYSLQRPHFSVVD